VGIKEKICTSAQLMPSSGCKAISHATTTIAAATSLDKDFQFFCFWSLFYSELTKSFFLFLIFFPERNTCVTSDQKLQSPVDVSYADGVSGHILPGTAHMASTEAL
jgi:hypothetical protein